jgi:NO-binding membrane sensor protein with MHYT domain
MDKLKIDKIKLADLSQEEQGKVVGGGQFGMGVAAMGQNNMAGGNNMAVGEQSWSTITVGIVILNTIATATYGATCHSNCNCLTANPGTQDSCGLCTTNYAC